MTKLVNCLGTAGSYEMGCRCEDCKKAAARARRKARNRGKPTVTCPVCDEPYFQDLYTHEMMGKCRPG